MYQDILAMTAAELRAALDSRRVSSVEATRAYLGRMEKLEPELNAYITVTADLALNMAERADRLIASGETGPMTGLPLGLKDVLVTEGVRTTCASKLLENFVPPYDGTVVARLRKEGAVFLGKLNMDEFAMGSSTENSAYGIVKNPWDTSLVPGGSSGGSAVAVAAKEAVMTLGTDTGGSIRQPAAFCGVVGLKPTYGRVSRYGLIAFASSLDQIGPFTRDVTDAALFLSAISGHDPADSTSVDRPVPDYSAALTGDVKGLRVGVPKEYFVEGMDGEIETRVREAVETMKGLGATVKEVSLPHTKYAVAVYYLVATAEASSNLARFDGVRFGVRRSDADLNEMFRETRARGFGEEVKRRIMLGTYSLSAGYYDAYYRKAQRVRALIARDFAEAFREVDVLLTPVTPTPAFKIGEKTGDPLQMYLSDIFTIPLNLAGLPGLSMPCGETSSGLPVGLQLMARPFDEETLLKAAYGYERATRPSPRLPGIGG